MPVVPLDEVVPAPQAAAVVVLAAREAGEDDRVRALVALLERTPAGVPLVLGADHATQARLAALDAGGARTVVPLDPGAALPALLAVADLLAPRAPVAVVDGATEVTEGWLDRLLAALEADAIVASASATSSHAALASLPERNLPWPLPAGGLTPEAAATRLAAGVPAPRRPRIPTPLPHCALLARPALDVAGPAPADAASDAAALLELGARATLAGLRHVLADDLFVGHRGPPAPADPARPFLPAGATEAAARHPWLLPALEDAALDRWSPLAGALQGAARALRGPSVTLDARGLTRGRTGTKVALVELALALQERVPGGIRVVLPDLPDPDLAARVRAGGARTLAASEVVEGLERTDVVHRPWAVDDPQDLVVADLLGERLVVTQHDLIGFHDPGVFADVEAWRAHRRTTRLALATAAAVLASSEATRADLGREELVDPARVRVVGLGLDHGALDADGPAQPPAGLGGADARPFLVAVGSHLRHKGLPFALDLLAQLRDAHGWDGELVIAGAEPLAGSSSADEALRRATDRDLGARVHVLGAVDDAARRWLTRHAAAVVYPSTVEGFGLVPFEAADHGTPCLWAPVGSLADVLPPELGVLVPWDPAASAAAALPLLADPGVAHAHVEAVRAAARGRTWARCAEEALAAYALATDLPAPAVAGVASRAAAVERELGATRGLAAEPGWQLVDPAAGLLDRLEQDRAAAALRPGGGRDGIRRATLAGLRGAAWLARRTAR